MAIPIFPLAPVIRIFVIVLLMVYHKHKGKVF